MSTDNYLDRLRSACYGWMESRTWWKRGLNRRRKDRVSGRSEKRGARQEERREIERGYDP